MIGDRSIVNNAARTMSVAVMSSEVVSLVYDMRWWVLLSLVLIAVDFWFGISESRMQGREVRKSKACRRTANKVVDYMCYLMVAGLLGKAMEPVGIDPIKLATIVMLLTSAWELDSIYGHICVLNGAEKDFSIRKFIVSLLKRKSEKIEEAAGEAKEDKPKVTNEQVEEARRQVKHINSDKHDAYDNK